MTRQYSHARKSWSEEDVEFLRTSSLTNVELAAHFGVAYTAIVRAKMRYGVNNLVKDNLTGREWRRVDEFPLYEVSSHGEIRNSRRGNLVRTRVDKNGYVCVQFKDECGKSINRTVHRLVAKAFLQNPDGKRDVNHKDGNKLNNSVSNLEWTTQAENMQHAFSNGLIVTPSGAVHWSRRDPEKFERCVRSKLRRV